MADNEQNEEYQFADLDSISPVTDEDELVKPEPIGRERASAASLSETFANPVRRNVAIVVGLIILLMILYKFFGSWFSAAPVKTAQEPQPPIIAQPKIEPPPVTIQPVVTQPAPATEELNKKISVLEVAQEGIKSDLNSLNNQYGSLNGSLADMSNQIAQLNQQINQLNAMLEQQSEVIASLKVRQQRPVVRAAPRPSAPPVTYYIQAVIPGRAWLIASNGSTLTVREGSTILGYGQVKLIDANQGRVVMSSGKVIRFSQDDS